MGEDAIWRLPPAGALVPSSALAAEPSGPPSDKQASIASPVAAQCGTTPDIHMQYIFVLLKKGSVERDGLHFNNPVNDLASI